MVATVGSISVDLSANTAKFTSDFNRAATTVDRQSKRMAGAVAGIGRQFASFGAGLAGGAAFAGLTSLTGLLNRTREAVGKLDDIADRAKTTGLGTDLLQSLEHGAKNAGIEVGQVSNSLTTFATNMGKAAEGTGRMYSGLLKLNPELLQALLSTEDQDERLRLVADALGATADATERAAISAAVFGDVDLARLFGEGAAGIDALVKEAKDLDLVFTPEQIRRAGEYDKKLNDLSASINKNIDESLTNLVPAIAQVTTAFLTGTEAVKDYVEGVDELGGVTKDFFNNPSLQNFMEMMFGAGAGKAFMSPEAVRAMLAQGGGGAFDQFLGGLDKFAHKPATGGGKPGTKTYNVPSASGGTAQVTVHGGGGVDDNKEAVEDVRKAVDDQTDATEEGFEESTRATGRVADSIYGLDGNLGGYFEDLGGHVRHVSDEIRHLAEERLQEFGTLADALSIGIMNGFDSLVGRQYTQQIKTPTDIIASGFGAGTTFGDQFLGERLANHTNTVNIVYKPDPGETIATSQQRMRAMLETAQRASARA